MLHPTRQFFADAKNCRVGWIFQDFTPKERCRNKGTD
jgi:hypothetical protein